MATALAALGSCHGDLAKPTATQQAGLRDTSHRYSIEVWEEPLVGGFGSHAAIIVRDRQQDQVVMLQGLATDRKTGDVKPMGSPGADDILAYAYAVGGSELAELNRAQRATLLKTDDGVDVMARLTAMLQAANKINDHRYAYQLLSSSKVAGREAYNSNATATSLLDAAGLRADSVTFGGYAPGWGQVIPSGYKKNVAQTRKTIAGAKQEHIAWFITQLAGKANARGELTKPQDDFDSALANYGGTSVGDFVTASDYNGEQAQRKALVADYKTLPLCVRRLPAFSSYDLPAVTDSSDLLYADSVIDEYYSGSPHGGSKVNVVHDAKLNKDCRTARSVSTQAEIEKNIAQGKALDQKPPTLPDRPMYKKPKVTVRIDL